MVALGGRRLIGVLPWRTAPTSSSQKTPLSPSPIPFRGLLLDTPLRWLANKMSKQKSPMGYIKTLGFTFVKVKRHFHCRVGWFCSRNLWGMNMHGWLQVNKLLKKQHERRVREGPSSALGLVLIKLKEFPNVPSTYKYIYYSFAPSIITLANNWFQKLVTFSSLSLSPVTIQHTGLKG